MTKPKTLKELSTIDVRAIYEGRLNKDVVNGIVKIKKNLSTKLWVSVFRLDGKVSCRVASTKEMAVYKSYMSALAMVLSS